LAYVFKSFFLSSNENITNNLKTVPIYLYTLNTIVSSSTEENNEDFIFSNFKNFFNNLNERFIQAKRHLWSFVETCFFLENLFLNFKLFLNFRTYFLLFKIILIQYLAIIPFILLFLFNFLIIFTNNNNTNNFSYFLIQIFQIVLLLSQFFTLIINHYLLFHLINKNKIIYNTKENENDYFFIKIYNKYLKFNLIFNIFEFFTSNLLASLLFSFIPGLFCLTKLIFTDKHQYVVAPKPKEIN